MKRLVVCCDGTWNRLDAKEATNVVKIAKSIANRDSNGIEQIVFYDEGVGTARGPLTTLRNCGGGAFGWGLDDNIERAYRFLSLNYKFGDEIYIFGFSRGAFTARSLGGLIRKCGLLKREHIEQTREALRIYRTRDKDANSEPALAFRAAKSFGLVCAEDLMAKTRDELVRFGIDTVDDNVLDAARQNLPSDPEVIHITYLGIWDTVGELGVPNTIPLSRYINQKYRFHDLRLAPIVRSARHATAIDENRVVFGLVPWTNLHELNDRLADGTGRNASERARYRQCWFPGDHGSVGGGTKASEPLAIVALEWILEGARDMGLEFQQGFAAGWPSGIASVPLPKPIRGWRDILLRLPGVRTRPWIDGQTINDVSDSAVLRWSESSNYRPQTLQEVGASISNEYSKRGLPMTYDPTG